MVERCDDCSGLNLAECKEADDEERRLLGSSDPAQKLLGGEQTEEQRSEGSCLTRGEHMEDFLDTRSPSEDGTPAGASQTGNIVYSDPVVQEDPDEVTLPAKDDRDVLALSRQTKGDASCLVMLQTHNEGQADRDGSEDRTYRSVLRQMLQEQKLKRGRRFKKKTLIKMAKMFMIAKGWDSEEINTLNQNRKVCTSSRSDTTSSGQTAAAPAVLKTIPEKEEMSDLVDLSPRCRLETERRQQRGSDMSSVSVMDTSQTDQARQQDNKLRKEARKVHLTVETAAESYGTAPEGGQGEVKAADSEAVLKPKKTKTVKTRGRRTEMRRRQASSTETDRKQSPLSDAASLNDGDSAATSAQTAAALKEESHLSGDPHMSTQMLDMSPQSRLERQQIVSNMSSVSVTGDTSEAQTAEQQTYKLRKRSIRAHFPAENNASAPEGSLLTSEWNQEEVKAADSEDVNRNTDKVLKRKTVQTRKKKRSNVMKRGAGVCSLLSSSIEVCFTGADLDCDGQSTQHKTQLSVRKPRNRRGITSNVVPPELRTLSLNYPELIKKMSEQSVKKAREERNVSEAVVTSEDFPGVSPSTKEEASLQSAKQEKVQKPRKKRVTSAKRKGSQQPLTGDASFQERTETRLNAAGVPTLRKSIRGKRAGQCEAANTPNVSAGFCSDIKTEPACELKKRQRPRKRSAQNGQVRARVPVKEERSEVQCDALNEERTIRRSPRKGIKVEEEEAGEAAFPKKKRRRTRTHKDNKNNNNSSEELQSSRSPRGGKKKIKSEPAEVLVDTTGGAESKKTRQRTVTRNNGETSGVMPQEVTSHPEDSLMKASPNRSHKKRRKVGAAVQSDNILKEILNPQDKKSSVATGVPTNVTKMAARGQRKQTAAPEANVSSLPENMKDKKKRKGKRAIRAECVSSLNPTSPKCVKSEPQDCLISPEETPEITRRGSADRKQRRNQNLEKCLVEESGLTAHKKGKKATEEMSKTKRRDTSDEGQNIGEAEDTFHEPETTSKVKDVNMNLNAENQTSPFFQIKTTKRRRSHKKAARRTVKRPLTGSLSRSSTSEPAGPKALQCRLCGRSFRHISAFTMHKRIHTGEKPFSCSTCGRRFAKLPQLHLHVKLHHREPCAVRCPCCQVSFQSKYEFMRHFKIHLNDTDSPMAQKEAAPPLRCPVCFKEFTKRSTFKMHRRRHDGKPFSCSVCGKNFCKPSSLNCHQKTHRPVKPYSCSVCLKAFDKLQELQSHSQTHSGPTLFSSSSSQPDVSDGFSVSQGADGTVLTPIYFKCPICKQLHRHWCHYVLHLRTHTEGESSPPCETCRQQAADTRRHCTVCCRKSGEEKACRSSLSDIWKEEASPHEETTAQSPPPPPPPSLSVNEGCGVRGLSVIPLRGHFATRRLHLCHTSRPFSCSRCDLEFHFLGSYIDHLREHAAQTPSSASTSCPSETSSHNSDRPFKCSTCGKLFSTFINLKKHKLLHKGAKSHLCLQCYLPFSSYSALKTHLKSHRKRLSVPQPGGIVEPLLFPYQCRICNAKFSSTDLLQAHQVCHFRAGRAPEERPAETLASHVLNTNEEDDVEESSQPKRQLPVSSKKHLFRYPHPDRLYVVPVVSSEPPTVVSDAEEETPSSHSPQTSAGRPAGSCMEVNDSSDSDLESVDLTPLFQFSEEKDVMHRCALCTHTFSDVSKLHQHYMDHTWQV